MSYPAPQSSNRSYEIEIGASRNVDAHATPMSRADMQVGPLVVTEQDSRFVLHFRLRRILVPLRRSRLFPICRSRSTTGILVTNLRLWEVRRLLCFLKCWRSLWKYYFGGQAMCSRRYDGSSPWSSCGIFFCGRKTSSDWGLPLLCSVVDL